MYAIFKEIIEMKKPHLAKIAFEDLLYCTCETSDWVQDDEERKTRRDTLAAQKAEWEELKRRGGAQGGAGMAAKVAFHEALGDFPPVWRRFQEEGAGSGGVARRG